jgi:osmotically-inducible protein OsmY
MFRALLKLVLLIIVIVAAGAFLLGWWGGGRVSDDHLGTGVVGTSGVDTAKARAAGAEAGEKVAEVADKTAVAAETAKEKTARAAEVAKEKTAEAAAEARKAIAEGSLTAKIKAKMALDDHVKALNLDVDTVGSVVTVSGYVHSQAERERALQLARDTAGVTQVVDKLTIRR